MLLVRSHSPEDTGVSEQANKNLTKSPGASNGLSASVFWFTGVCLSTCYNKMHFPFKPGDISPNFQSVCAYNSNQVQIKVKYYSEAKAGCMAGSNWFPSMVLCKCASYSIDLAKHLYSQHHSWHPTIINLIFISYSHEAEVILSNYRD